MKTIEIKSSLIDKSFVFKTGKYKGIPLHYVWILDPYYVHWLVINDLGFIIDIDYMHELSKKWVLIDESLDSFIADWPITTLDGGNFLYYDMEYDPFEDENRMVRARGRAYIALHWRLKEIETICEVIDCFPYEFVNEMTSLNNLKAYNIIPWLTTFRVDSELSLSALSYKSVFDKVLASPCHFVNNVTTAPNLTYILYSYFLNENAYHTNSRTGKIRKDGDLRSIQIAFKMVYDKVIKHFSPIRNLSSDLLDYISSLGVHKSYLKRNYTLDVSFAWVEDIDIQRFIDATLLKYGIKITSKNVTELMLFLKKDGQIKIAKSGALYVSEPHDWDVVGGYFSQFDEEEEEQEEYEYYKELSRGYGGDFTGYEEWYSRQTN